MKSRSVSHQSRKITAGNVKMSEEVDPMCFDNLDEFINDDNKLVTYKWLSRTLSLHVNQAKQLLHSFVDEQRNKKDNDCLTVTYFLAGLVKDGATTTYKVQVVPEECLEASKSTLDVVTSCHVYSVKKGKLKDSNSLYAADYDTLKENLFQTNKYSAVECVAAKLLSEEEIHKIHRTKHPVNEKPAPTPPSHQNGSSAPKPQIEKTKEKKPSGIAGLFAKSSTKSTANDKESKSEDKTSSKSEDKDVSSKGKNKPKQAGVMNFFSKQAAKPKQESKDTSPKTTEISKTKSPEKTKSSPITEIPKDVPKSSKTEKHAATKGKKKKAESDDEDPTPQQKKRRRIKVQSDSSSEDEMEMEQESPIPSPPPPESDPEEVPPTPSPPKRKKKAKPSPDPSPPPSPVPSPVANPEKTPAPVDDNEMSGKICKKKLVSKTFINDEGFMVTEKVYEDQWEDAPVDQKAPDISDKKPALKSKKASPTKKKTSPGKNSGKQTSMMSFFKKK